MAIDISNFGLQPKIDGGLVQRNSNRVYENERAILALKQALDELRAQILTKDDLNQMKKEVLESLKDKDMTKIHELENSVSEIEESLKGIGKLCAALGTRLDNVDAELDQLPDIVTDMIAVKAALQQLRPVTPTHKLTVAQQKVYDLRHRGLSQRDVAKELDKTESSISRTVKRIRKLGYQV